MNERKKYTITIEEREDGTYFSYCDWDLGFGLYLIDDSLNEALKNISKMILEGLNRKHE